MTGAAQKADQLKQNLGQIMQYGKLNAVQAGTLVGQIGMNPEVASLIPASQGNQPIDPKYKGLIEAIGQRYKDHPTLSTTTFVGQLNDDLARNPALKQEIARAAQTNPDAVAKALRTYQPGNLAGAMEGIRKDMAAAPAAPAPARPTAGPAVDPAAVPAAPAAPARPQPQAAPAPQRPAPSAAPAAVPAEPAAPTPQRPAPPAPPAGQQPSAAELAAANAAAGAAAMKELAGADDAKIKTMMTPARVAELADGIAAYAKQNFPGGAGKYGDDFANKIRSNPALQKQIADNLANNPQAVRNLAQAMSNPGTPLRDEKTGRLTTAGQAIDKTLSEIQRNPEWLTDKQYVVGLGNKAGMVQQLGAGGGFLGGIGAFFKNSMGIDLGGLMNNIGGMLKGLMSTVGQFFNQFSGGNFMQMGNVDPKRSFWSKLSEGMDRAQDFAAREPQMLKYSSVLPRPDAQGVKGDGLVRDSSGKPILQEQTVNGQTVQRPVYDPRHDHRVEVTTINGNNEKIYLTNGLSPQRQVGGNYRWTVATGIDATTGQPTGLKEIVLSKEESQRLHQQLTEAAQKSGTPLKVSDPAAQSQDPVLQRPDPNQPQTRNTIRVDAATGQTSIVEPAPRPVDQAPVVANAPGMNQDTRLKTPELATPGFNPNAT